MIRDPNGDLTLSQVNLNPVIVYIYLHTQNNTLLKLSFPSTVLMITTILNQIAGTNNLITNRIILLRMFIFLI